MEKSSLDLEKTRKKKTVAMFCPSKSLGKTRKRGYLSFISFEDCHSPWMLHIETAIRVPGLLVFIQAVAA